MAEPDGHGLHELRTFEPEPDDDTKPPLAPPGSVLEQVLARRQEQLQDRHLDLDVPGFNGQLVLRLEPLAPGVLAQIAGRAMKAKEGSPERLATNSDVLIKACREVLGRRTPDAEPEPLLPEQTLRIDQELAEALQMKATTARGLLVELFAAANDPTIAIANAASEYGDWCGEAINDTSDDLLGESRATRA